jgi:hypothetical protein
MKKIKLYEDFDGEGGTGEYMFWQNLETMKHAIEEMLKMDRSEVEALLKNGHAWAVDHIATSSDDVEEVYHFLSAKSDGEKEETEETEE